MTGTGGDDVMVARGIVKALKRLESGISTYVGVNDPQDRIGELDRDSSGLRDPPPFQGGAYGCPLACAPHVRKEASKGSIAQWEEERSPNWPTNAFDRIPQMQRFLELRPTAFALVKRHLKDPNKLVEFIVSAFPDDVKAEAEKQLCTTYSKKIEDIIATVQKMVDEGVQSAENVSAAFDWNAVVESKMFRYPGFDSGKHYIGPKKQGQKVWDEQFTCIRMPLNEEFRRRAEKLKKPKRFYHGTPIMNLYAFLWDMKPGISVANNPQFGGGISQGQEGFYTCAETYALKAMGYSTMSDPAVDGTMWHATIEFVADEDRVWNAGAKDQFCFSDPERVVPVAIHWHSAILNSNNKSTVYPWQQELPGGEWCYYSPELESHPVSPYPMFSVKDAVIVFKDKRKEEDVRIYREMNKALFPTGGESSEGEASASDTPSASSGTPKVAKGARTPAVSSGSALPASEDYKTGGVEANPEISQKAFEEKARVPEREKLLLELTRPEKVYSNIVDFGGRNAMFDSGWITFFEHMIKQRMSYMISEVDKLTVEAILHASYDEGTGGGPKGEDTAGRLAKVYRGLAAAQHDYAMCRLVDEGFERGHRAPVMEDLYEAGRKISYYGSSDSLLTLMAPNASKTAKKRRLAVDMWYDIAHTTLFEYIKKKAPEKNTSYRCVGKSGPSGSGFLAVKATLEENLIANVFSFQNDPSWAKRCKNGRLTEGPRVGVACVMGNELVEWEKEEGGVKRTLLTSQEEFEKAKKGCHQLCAFMLNAFDKSLIVLGGSGAIVGADDAQGYDARLEVLKDIIVGYGILVNDGTLLYENTYKSDQWHLYASQDNKDKMKRFVSNIFWYLAESLAACGGLETCKVDERVYDENRRVVESVETYRACEKNYSMFNTSKHFNTNGHQGDDMGKILTEVEELVPDTSVAQYVRSLNLAEMLRSARKGNEEADHFVKSIHGMPEVLCVACTSVRYCIIPGFCLTCGCVNTLVPAWRIVGREGIFVDGNPSIPAEIADYEGKDWDGDMGRVLESADLCNVNSLSGCKKLVQNMFMKGREKYLDYMKKFVDDISSVSCESYEFVNSKVRSLLDLAGDSKDQGSITESSAMPPPSTVPAKKQKAAERPTAPPIPSLQRNKMRTEEKGDRAQSSTQDESRKATSPSEGTAEDIEMGPEKTKEKALPSMQDEGRKADSPSEGGAGSGDEPKGVFADAPDEPILKAPENPFESKPSHVPETTQHKNITEMSEWHRSGTAAGHVFADRKGIWDINAYSKHSGNENMQACPTEKGKIVVIDRALAEMRKAVSPSKGFVSIPLSGEYNVPPRRICMPITGLLAGPDGSEIPKSNLTIMAHMIGWGYDFRFVEVHNARESLYRRRKLDGVLDNAQRWIWNNFTNLRNLKTPNTIMIKHFDTVEQKVTHALQNPSEVWADTNLAVVSRLNKAFPGRAYAIQHPETAQNPAFNDGAFKESGIPLGMKSRTLHSFVLTMETGARKFACDVPENSALQNEIMKGVGKQRLNVFPSKAGPSVPDSSGASASDPKGRRGRGKGAGTGRGKGKTWNVPIPPPPPPVSTDDLTAKEMAENLRKHKVEGAPLAMALPAKLAQAFVAEPEAELGAVDDEYTNFIESGKQVKRFRGVPIPVAVPKMNDRDESWSMLLCDTATESYMSKMSNAIPQKAAELLYELIISLDIEEQQIQTSRGTQFRKAGWIQLNPKCNCAYKYGGAVYHPLKLNEGQRKVLNEVREHIEKAIGGYNVFDCLNIMVYQFGQDALAFHSDNEPRFGGSKCHNLIASLSIGDSRQFVVKPKNYAQKFSDGSASRSFTLKNRDLVTMEGGMQVNYLHGIERKEDTKHVRVNTTWRTMVVHDDDCELCQECSDIQTMLPEDSEVPNEPEEEKGENQGPEIVKIEPVTTKRETSGAGGSVAGAKAGKHGEAVSQKDESIDTDMIAEAVGDVEAIEDSILEVQNRTEISSRYMTLEGVPVGYIMRDPISRSIGTQPGNRSEKEAARIKFLRMANAAAYKSVETIFKVVNFDASLTYKFQADASGTDLSPIEALRRAFSPVSKLKPDCVYVKGPMLREFLNKPESMSQLSAKVCSKIEDLILNVPADARKSLEEEPTWERIQETTGLTREDLDSWLPYAFFEKKWEATQAGNLSLSLWARIFDDCESQRIEGIVKMKDGSPFQIVCVRATGPKGEGYPDTARRDESMGFPVSITNNPTCIPDHLFITMNYVEYAEMMDDGCIVGKGFGGKGGSKWLKLLALPALDVNQPIGGRFPDPGHQICVILDSRWMVKQGYIFYLQSSGVFASPDIVWLKYALASYDFTTGEWLYLRQFKLKEKPAGTVMPYDYCQGKVNIGERSERPDAHWETVDDCYLTPAERQKGGQWIVETLPYMHCPICHDVVRVGACVCHHSGCGRISYPEGWPLFNEDIPSDVGDLRVELCGYNRDPRPKWGPFYESIIVSSIVSNVEREEGESDQKYNERKFALHTEERLKLLASRTIGVKSASCLRIAQFHPEPEKVDDRPLIDRSFTETKWLTGYANYGPTDKRRRTELNVKARGEIGSSQADKLCRPVQTGINWDITTHKGAKKLGGQNFRNFFDALENSTQQGFSDSKADLLKFRKDSWEYARPQMTLSFHYARMLKYRQMPDGEHINDEKWMAYRKRFVKELFTTGIIEPSEEEREEHGIPVPNLQDDPRARNTVPGQGHLPNVKQQGKKARRKKREAQAQPDAEHRSDTDTMDFSEMTNALRDSVESSGSGQDDDISFAQRPQKVDEERKGSLGGQGKGRGTGPGAPKGGKPAAASSSGSPDKGKHKGGKVWRPKVKEEGGTGPGAPKGEEPGAGSSIGKGTGKPGPTGKFGVNIPPDPADLGSVDRVTLPKSSSPTGPPPVPETREQYQARMAGRPPTPQAPPAPDRGQPSQKRSANDAGLGAGGSGTRPSGPSSWLDAAPGAAGGQGSSSSGSLTVPQVAAPIPMLNVAPVPGLHPVAQGFQMQGQFHHPGWNPHLPGFLMDPNTGLPFMPHPAAVPIPHMHGPPPHAVPPHGFYPAYPHGGLFVGTSNVGYASAPLIDQHYQDVKGKAGKGQKGKVGWRPGPYAGRSGKGKRSWW